MRETPCDACPCPSACKMWDIFCDWASEPRPDPVKIRHICSRSAGPPPRQEPTNPPSDSAPTIPVAEARRLVAAVKSCPFRSVGPGCGCGGGRCALRGGATVGHRDCFDCIRAYPDPA